LIIRGSNTNGSPSADDGGVRRTGDADNALAHLTLSYCPNGRSPPPMPGHAYGDGYLRIASEHLRPAFRLHERGDKIIGLCGNPAWKGKFDDLEVARALAEGTAPGGAAKIDSTFLAIVYDRVTHHLDLVSDRFASWKIYYRMHEGRFYSSTSLLQLSRTCGHRGEPDEEAIFEFLYFRRLFGEKTFDRDARFLAPASYLSLAPRCEQPLPKQYWSPNLTRSHLNPNAFAERLAEALRSSVSLHTSDGRRYGLMLSGGLDSRAVLAAAQNPLTCFTSCSEPNNEYEVAADLAQLAGVEHVFIRRTGDLLARELNRFTKASNGEHMLMNAQFYGHGPYVTRHADVVFTGLGLDVFFGGLYQPKRRTSFLGKPSLHFRLIPLPNDITDTFLSQVKYRQKASDPMGVVRPDMRARIKERLRAGIADIVRYSRSLSDDPYACWEFMHLQPFSRHYSFSMIDSIRSFAECRTPALNNELFALSLAMPARYKVNSEVYKRAITRLAPNLMEVRNANTNVRARAPQWRQSANLWARAAANRALGSRYRLPPRGRDRSWAEPAAFVAENTPVRDAICSLASSERLAGLDFVDMTRLGAMVADHIAARADHSILLLHLLGIDRFLAVR